MNENGTDNINMHVDLLALADGRLDGDPGHKARVESIVARSPELSARLRDYRAQTEALRRAFDPCLAEPVPERLQAVLDDARYHRRPRAARAVAAAILAVAACGAGWTAGRLTQPDPAAWMSQAVNLSAPPSMRGSDASVDIASTAQSVPTRLPDWLVAEVAPHLEMPDLSSVGLGLVGLGTVETAAGRVLRLDYQADDGRVINLFLRRRWHAHATGIQMTEENGVTITSWMEGPLATAVAGPMSRAQAIAVARAVRQALSNRYAGTLSNEGAVPSQEAPTHASVPDVTPLAPVLVPPAGRQPISSTLNPGVIDAPRSD